MRTFKRLLATAMVILMAAALGFWVRPVSYFNGWMYLHESLSGVENRDVQVAGHRLHYEVEGPASGPVVVLVHGLGASAEDWRALAPYLVQAGYRVYMPDLLGYGRSDKPANFSYSVEDEAGIVAGFLDALHLRQVDLGGWSMGGWIVQLVAAEHPERIRRLMILDSAGLYARPDWDTSLFTPTTPEQLSELYALLQPHPQPVPGFVVRDILRVSRERRWIMQRAMSSMLTGRDVTDSLLPQLKMPVLIVWGSLDQITPLELGEKMHRLIPQSELAVIPGCGHLAPLQCASQIGPRMVAFVKQ